MKRYLVLALLALAYSFAPAAQVGRNRFTVGEGKTPKKFDKYKTMKSSLRYHPREIRTDYSIPGHVIHWYSDGAAETNAIVHIDLRVQTNTVERKIDGLQQLNLALSNQIAIAVSKFGQMSNQWAAVSQRIEAIKTKNNSAIEQLETLKTKFPLAKSLIEKIEALVKIEDLSK